jgi:predicted dehydrogenase
MGLRHVEALQRVGMSVSGIADRYLDAAKSACQTYGLPAESAFSDGDRMLREIVPDAVVVATTAPAHCELVLLAADVGVRHILCEKPMAVSLEQCERMIAACTAAGARLAVNHQMRFMPHYTRVKALIGSPQFGPLVSVLVAGSNFGLAMNASHYFEMFKFVSDAPVDQVTAWLEPAHLANPRGPEFEDRSGRLRATNRAGHSLYIDFSAAAGHGAQCIYICQLGQIVVDELTGNVRAVSRRAEFRDLPTTRYGMPADADGFIIESLDTIASTAAVWEAMLSGRSYPDGVDGLHALSCLVAAHESHRSGANPIALAAPTTLRTEVFPWP